jgi:predicted DNA-binding protein (MmcQ/YjbR family)
MLQNQHIKSKLGQDIILQVRESTEPFPEVDEHIDKFGHTSFRIKDKPFVIIGESEKGIPSLAIKTLKTTQSFLLNQQDRFFKTPYVGQHGWISLHTDQPLDWKEIEELIKEAYLQTAPKKIVTAFRGLENPE